MRFWYLATPYTNYPEGRHAAFEMACDCAARLVLEKVGVFCPIAHSHPIADHLMPHHATDHDLWMGVDQPFMEAAVGLIVVKADGWQESRGVTKEIEHFTAACKPIIYWHPMHPAPVHELGDY